jgi:hypothetical protein
MEIQETLQDLWAKHSYWLIPLAWMVLSAVLNILFRKKSPEAWIEYGKKNPRMAALIRLCSSMGIDLHKALLAFKRMVDGKANVPKPLPALEVAGKVLDAVVDGVAPEEEKDDKDSKDEKKKDSEDKEEDASEDEDSKDDKEKDK